MSGEQAGRAFAVFRMAMQGAALGGAALGGALIAAVGPGWVLAADAVAFAVAGSLRAFLDVSHIPAREPGSGMLADLREGWREVAGRPWLWGIVVQFSVVNAVLGAADAVYGPLVAEDDLGGAAPWGVALGFFGAGTVVGALLDDPLEAAPVAASWASSASSRCRCRPPRSPYRCRYPPCARRCSWPARPSRCSASPG